MVPRRDVVVRMRNQNHSPLVASVTAKLTEMIRTRALPEGSGLPSERHLAAALSVSRGVVRAAIRELTDDGLLVSKPNCRPVVRQSWSKVPTGRRQIGIWLWPNAADYASASLLKGIQSANIDPDVRLVVANAPNGAWSAILESEAKFLRSLTEDSDDAGAIIWYLGRERNLDALREVRANHVPIVFLDRLPPAGFPADFVGTLNTVSAQKGVQHLIELGHRRIGLLSNMDDASSVGERETGYQRAMRDAGIAIQEGWIQRETIDHPESIEWALDNYLNHAEPPTAVFCINDQLGLQLYEAAQSRNVAVPDDLSIVGFDGLLRWVPGGGYLTTLCQDFERIG